MASGVPTKFRPDVIRAAADVLVAVVGNRVLNQEEVCELADELLETFAAAWQRMGGSEEKDEPDQDGA